MNKKILKTYDIRGIYPEEINEKEAYLASRAFFTFLNKEKAKIAVARDGRTSSPKIYEEVCRGVVDCGGEVLDMEISNTPLLNFAVASKDLDGGMMITASHNPSHFNGIKLIGKKALQVYGEDIKKIGLIAEKRDFIEGEGKRVSLDPLMDYTNHITSLYGEAKDLKVVVDCGNGVGAITAKPVLSSLPLDTVFIYEEVDGTFPNHDPNPHNLKNFDTLCERVVRESADLGVFFDGDADRSIIVDERGDVIPPDTLLSILAEEELRRYPGGKVYYDLRFSRAVPEKIKEMGGDPVMMKVGSPFYKEKIIKEDGVLGGEFSGHIMFKRNYGLDDGLFVALRTMDVINRKGKTLSALVSLFSSYFQSEEINLEVEDKEAVFERVKKNFDDGEELFIDGIYIKYPSWWFNLRKSNTEDLVRLRIEADTEDLLKEKREKLISLIKV